MIQNTKPEIIQALQDSSTELINWVQASASKGADFLTEQAPLFVNELIVWVGLSALISALTYIILAIVLFVSSFILLRVVNPKLQKRCESELDKHFVFAGSAIFGTLMVVIGFGQLSNSIPYIKTSVMSVVAPRVLVVEKAMELYKDGNLTY